MKASPAPEQGAEPALRLERLTKRYPTGERALSGVDLSVPRGQVLALIGPSGAGKSTLIRCVNRLTEPTEGRVFVGATEVSRLGRRELRAARRRIGMIFQEYALVERLTVMENVLSGSLGRYGFWRSVLRRFPTDAIRRAYQLLERVGLEGMADKRADALSGGERQRVGIARALHQEPELLLVDEPTASLDPRTSLRVMRLIVELCRERTLTAVINMHDVPLATRFADRIVGLGRGAVVFDGPPAALTAARLTEIYGAEEWEPAAAEPEGAELGAAEPEGAELGAAEPEGAELDAAEPAAEPDPE